MDKNNIFFILRRRGLIFIAIALLATLSGCAAGIPQKYDNAITLFANKEYDEALNLLSEIAHYEDSSTLMMYIKTIQLAESGEYELASSTFATMGDYRDSKYLNIYYNARQAEIENRYEDADALYRSIVTYGDSAMRMKALPALILERDFAIAMNDLKDESFDEEDGIAFTNLIERAYNQSDTKILKDIYDFANELFKDDDYGKAYGLFGLLANHGYNDSALRLQECVSMCEQELAGSVDSFDNGVAVDCED